MNKNFHYILSFVFLLLFFTKTNAQDTTIVTEAPPAEMADTSVYESSVSNYHFKEKEAVGQISVRTIPDQKVKKVRSDEDYWYVNLTPHREKKETKSPSKTKNIFNQRWFDTIFWILLIGGFIALLAWFLGTSNVSLFRKRIKNTGEEIASEIEAEDIFEINFEKEIKKALDASDFRLAVRMLYLRTLRDLSLKNLIDYTHEKTNTDYLFQLAGSPYYKTFFRLTRNFNYAWYGHFPVSQESFLVIQNDFNGFKQQLP